MYKSTMFQSCWDASYIEPVLRCLAQGHNNVPSMRLEQERSLDLSQALYH